MLIPANRENHPEDFEAVTIQWVLWNILMDQIAAAGGEATETDVAVARMAATDIAERLTQTSDGAPLVIFNDWSVGVLLSPDQVAAISQEMGMDISKSAVLGYAISIMKPAEPPLEFMQ